MLEKKRGTSKMLEEDSENYDRTCSCCCIDCIEGNHCGGVFTDIDDEGNEEVIGICNNPDALLELMSAEYFPDIDYPEDDDADSDYIEDEDDFNE